jgi:hypothetical protein
MTVVNIDIVQLLPINLCFVVNPTIQQGDKVTWTNKTTADVVLLFPHTAGLGPNVFCHTIAAGQTYHHLAAANKRNPAPGSAQEVFRYALFCHSVGRFAIGGSDPEIIIM